MDKTQKFRKIKAYAVSVEKAEEALKAIELPGVVSVQIIDNLLRLGAAFDVRETFVGLALEANLQATKEIRKLASGGAIALIHRRRHITAWADGHGPAPRAPHPYDR